MFLPKKMLSGTIFSQNECLPQATSHILNGEEIYVNIHLTISFETHKLRKQYSSQTTEGQTKGNDKVKERARETKTNKRISTVFKTKWKRKRIERTV